MPYILQCMGGSKVPHGIIYTAQLQHQEYIAESGVQKLSQGCIFGNSQLQHRETEFFCFFFAMEFIYAHIYACVLLSQQCKTAYACVPHWSFMKKLTHIAAIRFALTAVILNSIKWT